MSRTSRVHLGRRRRVSRRARTRVPLVLCLLTGLGLSASALSEARAGAAAAPYALVAVTGTPLGGLGVGSPYTLNPVFSPTTTDYDVSCQAGSNQVPSP